VGVLALLWANIHGSWVLLPCVLGLLTLAAVVDPRLRHAWLEPLKLAGVALVAGMINPTGWLTLASVWRFRDRTAHLLEWEPTIVSELGVLPFSLLVVLLLVTWARRRRVAWAEIIVVFGIVGFAMIAFRNVLFALTLLAPLTADALSPFARPRPTRPAEARALAAVSAGSVAACLAAALIIAAHTDPLAQARPLKIAQFLASVDGPKRVYNNYNTAGILLEFGGPRIELGIDGRADRYPADYTSRYFGAEGQLREWREVLAEVDPDYVVADRENPLPVLLEELQWRTLMVVPRNPPSN
jgi:hypothetical protein